MQHALFLIWPAIDHTSPCSCMRRWCTAILWFAALTAVLIVASLLPTSLFVDLSLSLYFSDVFEMSWSLERGDGTPAAQLSWGQNNASYSQGTNIPSSVVVRTYSADDAYKNTAQRTYSFSSLLLDVIQGNSKKKDRMYFDGNVVLHQFWDVQVYRTCCFVTSSTCTVYLLSVVMSVKATRQRLKVRARKRLRQEILWFSIPAEQFWSFCFGPSSFLQWQFSSLISLSLIIICQAKCPSQLSNVQDCQCFFCFF